MDERKEYTPPEAEIILLAPCDRLAAMDRKFGYNWKTPEGYFPAADDFASGVAFSGDFGVNDGDGFTFDSKQQ